MTQTLDNQTMLKNIFLKKNSGIEGRKGISLYLNILKEGSLYYTGNSGKLLQPCNGTSQLVGNHRSYGGKSMQFSCNTCHNPGDGLMAGVWNVAPGMETGRGNGPGQDGKMWQMWQGISGTCHRNISDRQHVTGPLQGGKGFPVFPERKGFSSQKLGLEVWKNVIGNRKKRS